MGRFSLGLIILGGNCPGPNFLGAIVLEPYLSGGYIQINYNGIIEKCMIAFIVNLLSFNNRMIIDLRAHCLKIQKQLRLNLRSISFCMKNP